MASLTPASTCSQPRAASRWVREIGALAILGAAIIATQIDVFTGGLLVGMDSATGFYPWYGFLGERMRAGEIPVWNPHQFSGAPFAADPESGWMYLPAMVAFSLLPVSVAASVFVASQAVLAGLGVYALGRTFRLGVLGSITAAVAYACGGFLFGHSICCFAYAGVATWFPFVILGAERALRATSMSERASWWTVAGFGLSQVFAVWIGQGAYYVLLALAAYVAYRRLAPLPRCFNSLGQSVSAMVLDISGMVLIGVGLGAAGIFPRMEFNLLSNLPLGYPQVEPEPHTVTALDWNLVQAWARLLLTPGFYALGLPVATAAVMAVVSVRLPPGVGFLGLVSLVVVVLSQQDPTPLHHALSLLPGFERLTGRSPQRAMLVLYLGPALLAGAAVGVRGVIARRTAILAAVITICAALGVFSGLDFAFAAIPVVIGLATLLAVHFLSPRARPVISVVVVLFMYAGLRVELLTELADARGGAAAYDLRALDLNDYFAPTDASRYLSAQLQGEPFRYVGYAGHVFGGPFPYTLRWADPGMRELEVNNRALATHLSDVQGYNPLHLARYDHLIDALNGSNQNYHHADIFEAGLDSPLLDVLNVRYLIFPTTAAADQTLPRMTRPVQLVFQTDTASVFENPRALPRAWIVHTARQANPDEALDLLARGVVDPRQVALLEAAPPDLHNPAGSSDDLVYVVVDAPEHQRIHVRTTAAGVLMLSEIYYPAWQAYVDGEPTALYPADGALRAVFVSAGEHDVDVRFESVTLRVGMAITLLTGTCLLALAAAQAWQLVQRRRATRSH